MAENPRLTRLVEVLRARAAPAGGDLDARRTDFDAATARSPLAAGVGVRATRLGGVAAEWLEPIDRQARHVVLHLHGGGYILGSLVTVRAMASHLARAARAAVVTVEYRLAPEAPFPAAVDDAMAAYRGLLADGHRPRDVVIAGDSAGGGLALATLVALRNQQVPLPCAAVLLSPWVDLTLSAPSLDGDADRDPQVSRELLEECARHYLAEASPSSPLASPLFADLSGLPPVLVHVGAAEILRDDGARLADALRRAGTAVTLECWDDMIHVWHQFAPGLPEASAALERVGAWLDPWWGEVVPAALGVDAGAGGEP